MANGGAHNEAAKFWVELLKSVLGIQFNGMRNDFWPLTIEHTADDGATELCVIFAFAIELFPS